MIAKCKTKDRNKLFVHGSAVMAPMLWQLARKGKLDEVRIVGNDLVPTCHLLYYKNHILSTPSLAPF